MVKVYRYFIADAIFTLGWILFVAIVINTKSTIHGIVYGCFVTFFFSLKYFWSPLDWLISAKHFFAFEVIERNSFAHLLQLRTTWNILFSALNQLSLSSRPIFRIISFTVNYYFVLLFFCLLFWDWILNDCCVFDVWFWKV